MSTGVRAAAVREGPAAPAIARPLLAILAVALGLRALFVASTGFHNDVAAFEAWTLALRDNPPWLFYAKTSFADYPPGYFLVLWVLGGVYSLLASLHVISTTDPSYLGLRLLVKLPAIAMDLVDAALIYAIVRRFATERLALFAAAAFAWNPATIYVSAFWGQVDSVSWGLVLMSLWWALRSADDPAKTVARLVWAWLAMAFSVLIKPQGVLVAVALAGYAFTAADPAVRRLRLTGTLAGVGAGLLLAFGAAALFHASANPIDDFSWLVQRYAFGSAVYPYNSINAFNLYAIKQSFWQPDLVPLTVFGVALGPMVLWGTALVLAAAALLVARYLQVATDRALLECAMLLAFAFFTLATRMHERYIYGAFLFVFPLLAFGRRYAWSAGLLSCTALLNLIYSLAYQTAMEAHTPGVDATHLWGPASSVVAALNVALFFALGYGYLGGTVPLLDEAERVWSGWSVRARTWFDPREGMATMTRLDWMLAAGFTFASFVVCIVWFQYPAEKIFDEIYYARAGEEYLQHKDIFEFTHPPLTKLIITLSMLLFGGLSPLGDSGVGWRFLNVVVGALSVGLIYLFGKSLLRSTFFASAAALMLLCDGFHFVQSRIATPEITVAFFALLVLYAFYRLWTATGARRAARIERSPRTLAVYGVALGIGAVVAAAVAYALVTFGPSTKGTDLRGVAGLVAFLYVETAFYLLARWATSAGRGYLDRLLGPVDARTGSDGDPFVVSYADGSRYVYDRKGAGKLFLPEGQGLAVAGKREELASADDGELARRYQRDGRLVYRTPVAEATFEPAGVVRTDGEVSDGGSAWKWLVLLGFASGAVAASKWNGLFDFFVVWLCVAGVAAQRYLRRPAVYGNPFGMPLDVVAGTMLLAAGAIYTLSYVPFFMLGHNFVDMVTLQREMYHYHATLVATHPYASSWWQWPILERPISYFYTEYEPYKVTHDPTACCVAEILALPNPFVWWFGMLTIPAIGYLAWRERNRGYALLVIAYVLQWLPWIGSPRIAFEYHFYPNLAMIVLANAIVLQRIWNEGRSRLATPRVAVWAYLAVVVGGFAFFYPVLAGVHVPWDQWHARMWINRWII